MMSDNKNTVYIFVKGNKGRASYEITNVSGDVLHSTVIERIEDKSGAPLWPIESDWVAIINGLKYVSDGRGVNSMPEQPIVFIFTTYENTYHVANHMKGTVKPKFSGFLDQYESIKKDLKRKSSVGRDDDVKMFWIPQGFVNRMDKVDELLKNSKKSTKPK